MFGSTRWTRLRPDELLLLGLAQECFKPLHFEPPEFGGRGPLLLGVHVGQVFLVLISRQRLSFSRTTLSAV